MQHNHRFVPRKLTFICPCGFYKHINTVIFFTYYIYLFNPFTFVSQHCFYILCFILTEKKMYLVVCIQVLTMCVDLAAVPLRTFDLGESFLPLHIFFSLFSAPLSLSPLAEAKRLKRVESKIFSLVSWTPGCLKGSKAVCIKPRPSKTTNSVFEVIKLPPTRKRRKEKKKTDSH